jgi:hypothetical protein
MMCVVDGKRVKAHQRGATTFAVPPVAHLGQRLQQMSPRDRDAASHPDHPTATLGLRFPQGSTGPEVDDHTFTGGGQPFGDLSLVHDNPT